MENLNKIFKALEFAANRHKYQTRKGVGKIPYINHPIKVAKLLIDFDEDDTDLIVAALLHDVVEDTAQGEKQIKSLPAGTDILSGPIKLNNLYTTTCFSNF